MKPKIGLALLLLILVGCVSPSSNLQPLFLDNEPLTNTFKDPEANFSSFRTFSVFPYSVISENHQMNPILEKQLLFMLRNQMETAGYQFVDLNMTPDIILTIEARSDYKESFIPPQTKTLPIYVPGQTVTSFGSSSGSFNYNTSGKYPNYGWGNYSGTSTSTTYLPGYLTTQTYTKPGYTVARYYPTVAISAFDTKSLRKIWYGTGVGISQNSDIRVSGQIVLGSALKEFPKCSSSIVDSDGRLPFRFAIVTVDGNNFFPVALNPTDSARDEGIRNHDIIMSINGISMMNKAFSEVWDHVKGNPGTKCQIKVGRTGETVDMVIRRVNLSEVK